MTERLKRIFIALGLAASCCGLPLVTMFWLPQQTYRDCCSSQESDPYKLLISLGYVKAEFGKLGALQWKDVHLVDHPDVFAHFSGGIGASGGNLLWEDYITLECVDGKVVKRKCRFVTFMDE